MIQEIASAAVEPFRHTIGWQAFAYGVTGKIILIYAKSFLSQFSEGFKDADEEAQEEIKDEEE